ncbi:hypothetical protein SAMN05216392_0870 [Streptococcus equinus]|uniref:AB hydrolase-1 domain-containing protein n=1 Tax=Streptococcus equinus TaxID=1335 RepID=A0A1H0YU01_STREI|nr:alpha/beta hydrolase [Streptococcus equinus]SDQ18649.1 hypothetical protein SAMN05216392_0870 [Streptococcus equinus]
MLCHEFGDSSKPIIILLPGTMCHWYANFAKVIPSLIEDFFVVVISYTGFDINDKSDYTSVLAEVEKIEARIKHSYQGKVLAVYGSSLGGTFVAHLVARRKIRLSYAVIGSSDFDQSRRLPAYLKSKLLVNLMWPYVAKGHFKPKCLHSYFEKASAKDSYVKEIFSFVKGMKFVSKTSLFNQYFSDLVTPLPCHVESSDCQVHIFYAEKMGKKYLKRYQEHFKNPIIHRQNYRHEELLVSYPEKWYQSVMAICNI